MKKIIVIFILTFNISAYATEQAMDIMIYKDSVSFLFSDKLLSDYHPISGYPLEYLLWTPKNDTLNTKLINDVCKIYRWCYRGYIAKWKIRNDSLFLTEIFYIPTVTAFVDKDPSNPYPLQKLFPERKITSEAFADWFSGFVNTVMYQSTYPPFDSDEWKDKRKRFLVSAGRVIAVMRS